MSLKTTLAMSEEKYCPLKFGKPSIKDWEESWQCEKYKCAWYDSTYMKCAILGLFYQTKQED